MKKVLSVAALAALAGAANAQSALDQAVELVKSDVHVRQSVTSGRVAGSVVWDTKYNTAITGTGSTPRTFMNTPIASLAGSGTLALTGLDCTVANFNTTALNVTALRLNAYFWGGFGTGTNATDLVFTNLLAQGTVDFNVGTGFSFGASTFLDIGAALGTPDASQAVDISALNISVPVNGLAGVTFNWQVGISGGALASNAGITSGLITSLTTPAAGPQTVGVNAFGAAGGFFRNASGLTTGNFQNNDSRNFTGASNTAVAYRLYATPTPGAASLLGVAGIAAIRRRRA